MSDLPPFDELRRRFNITARPGGIVVLPFDKLQALLRVFLELVIVDEEWYKANYPDVVDGIREGAVSSAKDHFIHNGYFENRLPHEIRVDEQWYLSANPDVAAAVKAGLTSARAHFSEDGYREGRSPIPPAASASERPSSPAPIRPATRFSEHR